MCHCSHIFIIIFHHLPPSSIIFHHLALLYVQHLCRSPAAFFRSVPIIISIVSRRARALFRPFNSSLVILHNFTSIQTTPASPYLWLSSLVSSPFRQFADLFAQFNRERSLHVIAAFQHVTTATVTVTVTVTGAAHSFTFFVTHSHIWPGDRLSPFPALFFFPLPTCGERTGASSFSNKKPREREKERKAFFLSFPLIWRLNEMLL